MKFKMSELPQELENFTSVIYLLSKKKKGIFMQRLGPEETGLSPDVPQVTVCIASRCEANSVQTLNN